MPSAQVLAGQMAGSGVQLLQTMTQTSDTDFAHQEVSYPFPHNSLQCSIGKPALAEYEYLYNNRVYTNVGLIVMYCHIMSLSTQGNNTLHKDMKKSVIEE